jgi:hypothetical protein
LIEMAPIGGEIPEALVDGTPEAEGFGVVGGLRFEREEQRSRLFQGSFLRGLFAFVSQQGEALYNIWLRGSPGSSYEVADDAEQAFGRGKIRAFHAGVHLLH